MNKLLSALFTISVSINIFGMGEWTRAAYRSTQHKLQDSPPVVTTRQSASVEYKRSTEKKIAASAPTQKSEPFATFFSENTKNALKSLSLRGKLNIRTREPLTGQTYKELIELQARTGDQFFVAQVTSQDSSDTNNPAFIQYYDAHRFNQYIMDQYDHFFEMTPTEKISFNGRNDPITNLPIKTVHYLVRDTTGLTPGYRFLCDYKQLFIDDQSNGLWQTRFYANQNDIENPKKCSAKKQALAGLYKKATDLYRQGDYKATLDVLIPLSQQFTCPETQIMALYVIGNCYRHGNDQIAKDWEKAVAYYLPVTNQSIDLELKIMALGFIGSLYYRGGHGVNKNFKKVHECFERVAQQTTDISAYDEAVRHLALIYLCGGHGIEKDFRVARKFFKLAAQSDDQETKDQAHLNLGIMYCHGGNGITKNNARAYTYLAHAATSPDANIQSLALLYLGIIYRDGGNGIESSPLTAISFFDHVLKQPASNTSCHSDALLGLFPTLVAHWDLIQKNTQAFLTSLKHIDTSYLNEKAKITLATLIGMLHYSDDILQRDYKAALAYLEPVTQQTIDPTSKLYAAMYIGALYTRGGFGVLKHYAKAIPHLEIVANQTILLDLQANACYYLGSIYLDGDLQIPKDLITAAKYLERAAKQSFAPGVQKNARALLEKIKEKNKQCTIQ